MLHVRLCTIQRQNVDEAFGFELWRSRRKSVSSGESSADANSDLLIVKSVNAGGPADNGNLKEGDKIIAVDGTNVRDAKSVRDLLASVTEARIMVERWEGGPNVAEAVDRKASTPSQRHLRTGDSSRRRSNTMRNTIQADLDVQRWPRNYGSAQNYPSAGAAGEGGASGGSTPTTPTARQIALHSQVSLLREDQLSKTYADRESSNRIGRRQVDSASISNNDDQQQRDDDDPPRPSILDVCPEGRFLLNIAGRGLYSEDLRGD